MIDPVSGLGGIVVGAFASKELVNKLLGPTADYFGSGLKDLVEKRRDIFGKIIKNASEKVEDLSQAGSVPPRVIRDALDHGTFSDEAISVEYFGGVLASARSGVSRDDRAATISANLSRLSAYQMRTHYILYSCMWAANLGLSHNINGTDGRRKCATYIPLEVYFIAMDLQGDEVHQAWDLMTHSIWGLVREGLLENEFAFGGPEHMKAQGVGGDVSNGGIMASPTVLGAELFFRGQGLKTMPVLFADTDLKLRSLGDITVPTGSRRAREVAAS